MSHTGVCVTEILNEFRNSGTLEMRKYDIMETLYQYAFSPEKRPDVIRILETLCRNEKDAAGNPVFSSIDILSVIDVCERLYRGGVIDACGYGCYLNSAEKAFRNVSGYCPSFLRETVEMKKKMLTCLNDGNSMINRYKENPAAFAAAVA